VVSIGTDRILADLEPQRLAIRSPEDGEVFLVEMNRRMTLHVAEVAFTAITTTPDMTVEAADEWAKSLCIRYIEDVRDTYLQNGITDPVRLAALEKATADTFATRLNELFAGPPQVGRA
jgi:hypothetical protein